MNDNPPVDVLHALVSRPLFLWKIHHMEYLFEKTLDHPPPLFSLAAPLIDLSDDTDPCRPRQSDKQKGPGALGDRIVPR